MAHGRRMPRGIATQSGKRVAASQYFLLFLLLVPLSPAIHADAEFTVQLRWEHQFQFAGYYMALENGYYKEAGLEVELLEGGPHALRPVGDLLDGRVDFAISNSGVLLERMEGKPVVALAAIAQTSPIVWIVLGDSDIHTPLDLADKRLMLMPPMESAELLTMLRREGIDPDELDLIPTTLNLDDLIEGRVDAYDGYSSNEPWYLEHRGVDYRLLRPRDYGVNFYNDILITREDLIEQHPDEVDAFVEATLRGWRYALDNIDEAVELIHRKYAPNKSREHLRFEAEQLRELIMPDLVSLGHMNPARWEQIGAKYEALEMVSGPVELDGFLYEGRSETDYTWLKRATLLTVAVMGMLALLVLHFVRLNRKLQHEASRRVDVERMLREKQEELVRLASTDPLTGAWNRLRFDREVRRELRRSERHGYPLSLIFMDLDHFKDINDQFGHAVGDEVLCRVTECVQNVMRESDGLCRWGGEEFVVLAPHTDLDQARQLAERVREVVLTSDSREGGSVSVSLGVAERTPGERLEDWLKRADNALLQAKDQGRNRVVVASA
ncbi:MULTISPECIES: GGDEF domain-containing protein [unclassified Thioalkalivibrio]|uniref:GGDEF domain-containing protein n=1 Tax=unclassified Thioalkalivibrio TaxID=2621013 RepID=UPI001E410520|nr:MULTISPECIES: GGDEF domain-containing protein [unclassified Thioalkalivibrio]